MNNKFPDEIVSGLIGLYFELTDIQEELRKIREKEDPIHFSNEKIRIISMKKFYDEDRKRVLEKSLERHKSSSNYNKENKNE